MYINNEKKVFKTNGNYSLLKKIQWIKTKYFRKRKISDRENQRIRSTTSFHRWRVCNRNRQFVTLLYWAMVGRGCRLFGGGINVARNSTNSFSYLPTNAKWEGSVNTRKTITFLNNAYNHTNHKKFILLIHKILWENKNFKHKSNRSRQWKLRVVKSSF